MAEEQVKVIKINWRELFSPIPGFQCGAGLSNRLDIEREIIPIIFVPGIMGSRLKDSAGKKVWDPDDALFMVNTYGKFNVTAQQRKALVIGERFDMNYLSVFEDDAEHNQKFADKQDTGRAARGWGGVSWSSYGPFLEALQQRDYTDAVDALWSEPIRHCFEFPVHAFGYNWTASNGDAGKKLAAYIDEVMALYTCQGRICERVILVTHSMGGLVARSACKLHGAESKVLGIVHGVQPAFGAPAAYWRMKSGFERPQGGPTDSIWDWFRNPLKMTKHKVLGTVAAWVLGTDGEEVTSLLGNMPGGLQLLPNKLYVDNKGNTAWLYFDDAQGQVALPKSDPYEEIYRKQDVFYRLVDPAWLDPGKDTAASNKGLFEQRSPWKYYESYLKNAERFHDQLGNQVHPQTFQFYSEGLPTAERIEFKREAHSREQYQDSERSAKRGGFRTAVPEDEASHHDIKLDTETVLAYTLQPPQGSGDGTVPVSSAKGLPAQVRDWVEGTSTVAINDSHESWFDRGHEPIYKTRAGQHIACAAIENLALLKIEDHVGPPPP